MAVDKRKTRIEPLYLGLAPLVFTFFSFIKLPSADVLSFSDPLSPLYFFLFYCMAGLLSLFLIFTLASARPEKAFYIPAIVCILPTIAGIGLCFAYGVTAFGFPAQFSIGAALVGIGSALLFSMWGYACGFLEKQAIVPTLAAVFALAYLIKILVAPFISGSFNLLIVGAAIILSALPLDSLVRSAEKKGRTPDARSLMTIRSSLGKLWRPLLGCSLLCLIWGSTWGSSMVGADLSTGGDGFPNFGEIIVFLTPCVVCVLALWKQVSVEQNFVLSIAVGLLILAWLFRFLENTGADYLADIMSGIAFGLLPLVLWAWCCEVAAKQPKRTQSLFVLSQALLTGVILIAFAGTFLVGARVAELATPTCSIILFILYARNASSQPVTTGSSLANGNQAGGLSDQATTIATLEENFGLTPRESEICFYFARGHSAKYISEQLYVSHNTVKTHVKRIYEKLGISSKDELISLLSDLPDHHGI